MSRKHSPHNLDLNADPHEIQIGSIVIFHRATLMRHDRFTHNELIQACNDYLWYGRLSEKLSGKASPWDTNSENEVTPPGVFYEAASLVGLTSKPSSASP